MFKINGNPEEFADLGVFHKLSKQFLPYAQERLGFDKPVGINLISDPQNAKNPLGKTAYYNPGNMEVTVFVDNRHIKDILRSMSHELVHHTQNCRGEFDGGVDTGPGYAQEDGHMRKMEEEAYLEGQMLLRDFEDTIKKENRQMSKLNEEKHTDEKWQKATLRQVINFYNKDAAADAHGDRSFRQRVMNYLKKSEPTVEPEQAAEANFEEGKEPVEELKMVDNPKGGGKVPFYAADGKGSGDLTNEESLEEGDGTICEECGGNGLHESSCGKKDDKENLEEDDKKKKEAEEKVKKKYPHLDPDNPKYAGPPATNENLQEGWSKKKDQLLFERLVYKWIK